MKLTGRGFFGGAIAAPAAIRVAKIANTKPLARVSNIKRPTRTLPEWRPDVEYAPADIVGLNGKPYMAMSGQSAGEWSDWIMVGK